MLKVGITGGIGSGKSTVCRVFEILGIPVFYADAAARWLMEHDESLIYDIKQLFGDAAYQNGQLDRPFIASIVFSHPDKLRQLNALTHPATFRYAEEWIAQQNAPYIIKEAAILFESGSHKELDAVIGVYAPIDIRIKRVLLRDNTSEQKVRERIAQQMDEDEKMKLCDYIITNDDVKPLIPQVLGLHEILFKNSIN
ncbi:MAG: dephospho-CoA kinase [Bacteroidota bacterium]